MLKQDLQIAPAVPGLGTKRVEEMLEKARNLVHAALEQSKEQRQAMRQMVEDYPDTAYFELADALLMSARRQVRFISGRITMCAPDALVKFRHELRSVVQRGTDLSLLYHVDSLGSHNREDFLTAMAGNGADVRVSNADANGMLIIDRSAALVWGNGSDSRHCQLIRSPTIVAPLLTLADTMWRSAWGLDALPELRRWDHELFLDVLRLLSEGHKDEVAARQLDVSVRTYRRYVAELMTVLRATSRFEAGVRAAMLGLVSDDHGTALRRTA